jgi:carbonic anhydrase/acetyltransferase-like protein (isoleucine patch superfamily)
MIDGRLLVDVHVHPARLPGLKVPWPVWVQDFDDPRVRELYDPAGTVRPDAFDAYLEAEGVDIAVVLAEYSPKVTGIQAVEDMLPLAARHPCLPPQARGSRAMIYALDDIEPDISPGAYVHPDATIIGAVTIGAESTIWPGAVLRGDHGRIDIGSGTSIQDGTIIHSTQRWRTTIGSGCVVGHAAHLEGCQVGDGCLIGSGSIVLARAIVEPGGAVGAAALVTEDMVIPAGYIALGVPARLRPMPAGLADWIAEAVQTYIASGKHYRAGLRRIG